MRLNKYGRFADFWRGDGVFVSFTLTDRFLTFAARWRWGLAKVHPPAKPWCTRYYLGPFEIEISRFN